MKKTIVFSLLAIIATALIAQDALEVRSVRRLERTQAISTEAQFNKVDNVWNLVNRPAKTNLSLQRIEIYRQVIQEERDTNNVITVSASTNYIVKAWEDIRVKLVED